MVHSNRKESRSDFPKHKISLEPKTTSAAFKLQPPRTAQSPQPEQRNYDSNENISRRGVIHHDFCVISRSIAIDTPTIEEIYDRTLVFSSSGVCWHAPGTALGAMRERWMRALSNWREVSETIRLQLAKCPLLCAFRFAIRTMRKQDPNMQNNVVDAQVWQSVIKTNI